MDISGWPVRDPLGGEGILFLALRRWYETWKNNQRVASILSESQRLLYVGRPTPLRETIRRAMGRRRRPPILDRINRNLIVYNEPLAFARSRFLPQINRATGLLRMAHVRYLASRLLGNFPILWVVDPLAAPLLAGFRTKLLVYHMIDDYQSYLPDSAGERRSEVARREGRLLEEADVVFAVSDILRQRALARNPHSYLIPNGVDNRLCAAAVADPRVPPDMLSLSRPIIGYVGVIQSTLDFRLLDEVASGHPGWSFVFVGPLELGSQEQGFHLLLRRENVYYLGPKPALSVPHYVKHCDVCIMPDRERPGTDPLKLYEYLACGRPVVALDNPSVRRFAGLVEIAGDTREFAAALERSLHDPSGSAELRMTAAHAHSWHARVDAMRAVLRERLKATGGAARSVLRSAPRGAV